MKINFRRKAINNETKLRIVTDYNGNVPIKNILTRYSISKQTLYNILHQKVGDNS